MPAVLDISRLDSSLGPGQLARVTGDWTFAALAPQRRDLQQRLADLRSSGEPALAWDLSGLQSLDDVGAIWLAEALQGAAPVEIPERFRERLEQARGHAARRPKKERYDPLSPIVALGMQGLYSIGHLRDGIALLGRLALDALLVVRRPSEFPLLEISANVFRSGVSALPVSMLVGFLVGVVLTYLSALQLKSYGADLLVINIVSIGVVRELGPMLASIIAAGRSGSTMTAQLGVMRVTEEIEALRVMGVSVTSRLVLPKVIGLAVALPLVTFATDVAALLGGMLAARITLGIQFAAFADALPRVLDVSHMWIGIGKSTVFGFAVAFIACHYGLRIRPNTESLGAGVTRSVVSAITGVILLDAIFAIVLRNIPS